MRKNGIFRVVLGGCADRLRAVSQTLLGSIPTGPCPAARGKETERRAHATRAPAAAGKPLPHPPSAEAGCGQAWHPPPRSPRVAAALPAPWGYARRRPALPPHAARHSATRVAPAAGSAGPVETISEDERWPPARRPPHAAAPDPPPAFLAWPRSPSAVVARDGWPRASTRARRPEPLRPRASPAVGWLRVASEHEGQAIGRGQERKHGSVTLAYNLAHHRGWKPRRHC
jgi:hypothetical protein